MHIDWNFVFTLVTAVVAIFAVIQTQQQIKLSNKQYLFDKRMEVYLVAMGLIELYRSNRSLFEEHDKNEPFLAIDFDFTFMTNNASLFQIANAIRKPLEDPGHKEYLKKLEELKEVATKIKFLFSGEAANILSDFVLNYQELLRAMYQYKIILIKMEEVNQNQTLTIEQAQQVVGEEKVRVNLQEAIARVKQADMTLKRENVEERLKKQIKLS